jgi:DNA-binding response OmpR family regulator
MPKFKALIVEDEGDIAQLIALQVENLGGEAILCHSGEAALTLPIPSFDIACLDLMLPDMDGIELCLKIKHLHPELPIMMLTARTDEIDRVLGLEVGADDYVTKPFSLAELRARIKALLRRSQISSSLQTPSSRGLVCLNSLKIDLNAHQIWLQGQALSLTLKEFDLLTLFAQNPDQVFSKSQLLDQVWQTQHQGYEHTVNSHINRLRKKLELDPAHPQRIQTIWGMGYKLNSHHF